MNLEWLDYSRAKATIDVVFVGACVNDSELTQHLVAARQALNMNPINVE